MSTPNGGKAFQNRVHPDRDEDDDGPPPPIAPYNPPPHLQHPHHQQQQQQQQTHHHHNTATDEPTASPTPTVGQGPGHHEHVHIHVHQHHSPSGGGAPAGVIPPNTPQAKRSSVFSGRPDEHPQHHQHHEADEEEIEDHELGRSAFNRQRSIITYAASSHRLELLIATFNLCVHIGTILTDLLLISDYSQNDQNVSATALGVIRVIVGLVEIEFDFINRGWGGGRFLLTPLIFFNLRIVVDYIKYIRDWWRYRQAVWAGSDFRAQVSFETFIGSLPSLIVQTYVMIADPRPMQQIWIVAYIMTSLSIAIDLLHHYKYVSVDFNIYVAQFVKALISTGLRTILVAQLLVSIGRAVLGWMIVSFAVGVFMYYLSCVYARKHGRDDPFQFGGKILHSSFGGLVAATVLFVSIPFAPSHSVYDWWLGYLMGEFKMAIENFIMLGIVLADIHAKYRKDLFYSVLALTMICYLGNLFACWFIHQHVRKQLRKRNIYSDTSIVKLFAHFGAYLKATWYPESLNTHGTAQNHLMYKDSTGKVPDHLQDEHDNAWHRTETMNQALSRKLSSPKNGQKDSQAPQL